MSNQKRVMMFQIQASEFNLNFFFHSVIREPGKNIPSAVCSFLIKYNRWDTLRFLKEELISGIYI